MDQILLNLFDCSLEYDNFIRNLPTKKSAKVPLVCSRPPDMPNLYIIHFHCSINQLPENPIQFEYFLPSWFQFSSLEVI